MLLPYGNATPNSFKVMCDRVPAREYRNESRSDNERGAKKGHAMAKR
jgi:hypothetical protein